jgi:hypothetical protein
MIAACAACRSVWPPSCPSPWPQAAEARAGTAARGERPVPRAALTIDTAASSSSAATPVYAPAAYDWSAPPTVYPAPPFVLPTGGGFHVTCSWYNSTQVTVTDGASAIDEECLVVAYYYPAQAFVKCIHTNGFDACN